VADRAFALAAHPDDIEFLMAGTLLHLGAAGWELHYMNIATGSCGTASEPRDRIVRRRTAEAQEAAAALGATWHPPLVDDIEVVYEQSLLARVGAVMREVAPRILLLQSPADYMEDHTNAARLGATAAFCRGMRNWPTDPPRDPVPGEVTVYHAAPHGNRDPLRRLVRSELYVDIEAVLAEKRAALACHRSQKEWLDVSQGMDAYLTTMEALAAETGSLSGRCRYAEGWRRRNPLGFCAAEADPLGEALAGTSHRDPAYEKRLDIPR
jgi:LmbE family N-acetylglucosaminyl deacetylase